MRGFFAQDREIDCVFSKLFPNAVESRIKYFVQQFEELQKDTSGALQSVSRRKFDKWEVYDCKEAMLVGSTTFVTSIVHFNGKDIGDNAFGNE